LINGGVVIAVLLMGSTIVDVEKNGSIEVELINQTPPAIEVKRDAKVVKPPKSDAPPETSARKGQAQGSNDLATPKDDPIGADPGPGLIAPKPDPIIETPPAPLPVLKLARPDPRYAASLQPEYPSSMIRAELEGAVTVRVLVGTDGRVKQVETVSASSGAFEEATRRHALRSWRFLPATRGGVAEESWREMTVRFRLPD
jgi:protein TonB